MTQKGQKNKSRAERCAWGARLIGRVMCRGGREGVTGSVIGQGASWERPRVQSGDFGLGGQSRGGGRKISLDWWCLDTSAVADTSYQRPRLVRAESGSNVNYHAGKTHTRRHTRQAVWVKEWTPKIGGDT